MDDFWTQADADSRALGGHVELAEGEWGNPAFPRRTELVTDLQARYPGLELGTEDVKVEANGDLTVDGMDPYDWAASMTDAQE